MTRSEGELRLQEIVDFLALFQGFEMEMKTRLVNWDNLSQLGQEASEALGSVEV